MIWLKQALQTLSKMLTKNDTASHVSTKHSACQVPDLARATPDAYIPSLQPGVQLTLRSDIAELGELINRCRGTTQALTPNRAM